MVALRFVLLLVALLAYTVNGARLHLTGGVDTVLEIGLCGLGHGKTVTKVIDGGPIEATDEGCCGDCLNPAPPLPPAVILPRPLQLAPVLDVPEPTTGPQRSPLWPGAPPQGPPATRMM